MKQRSRDAAYLVTANDLFSGQTVYHCGSGWSARLEDAAQLATSDEAANAAARLNVSDAGVNCRGLCDGPGSRRAPDSQP